MKNQVGDVESKLESMTIAQSEWERLSHMSLDELESNRDTLKTPYTVGDYQVSINLGKQGEFLGGKCNESITSGHFANCFNDTAITVYQDGKRLYTTRTLPLMAGNYTRKELEDKFASLDTKITNNTDSITNLTNRLINGKEDGTLKAERKYYLEFRPQITTGFYYNGGRPFADGKINVNYYYTDEIYKDTPSEKMIIFSNRKMVNSTILPDGLFYDSDTSGDPGNEAFKKANDYIREHANHFLEEAYEKIPEARNADEIIY